MCGLICSASTLAVGVTMVVVSSVFSYVFLPDIIDNVIKGETVLINDTIQMERFEALPFPVNFTIRIFNITNLEDVMDGGVPSVSEVGPYIYRLYQTREIVASDEHTLTYRRWERFEFDAIASYPNTEEDMVTIVNVPYFAIIQVAERMFPSVVSVLNMALNGVFGEYNNPFATFKVRNLLFDGIPLCNSSGLIADVACGIIREIAATTQNIEVNEDGSMSFTVLAYKERGPSEEYKVSRGLSNSVDLGRILLYGGSHHFEFWNNEQDLDGSERVSVCNMINGTDAGIFAPFVDRERNIYAINTDICRSVELRYEADDEYEGVPTVRYSAREWFLANDEGCFCLNVTSGINREDGCLLRGGMELYSCVGAPLVLSYPHFLYADPAYRDGVIGMRPNHEIHKIFMELEPNTGTPVKGAKRAQFNVFMRPVNGIPPTQTLRTTLMPFLWVEEGITLPEEFVSELTDRLLRSLNIVDIIVPVLIAACCLVTAVGVVFTVKAKMRKPDNTLLGASTQKP